jgi:hypothetical protein
MRELKEPMSVIIGTHLFVEHAVNYLIYVNCKNPAALLDDRKLSFSRKLDLVYAM